MNNNSIEKIQPVLRKPHYTISESDNKYEIKVTLPGVKKTDLDITIENQILNIKANYQAEKVDMEIIYEHIPSHIIYEITLQLGKNIDIDKTQSDLNNGILLLTLEKNDTFKKKRISIS